MRLGTIVGSWIAVVAISSYAYALDPFDVQFERVYGTSAKDFAYSVVATSDGGYLAVGQSPGFNVDGRSEGYAIKTDANGDVQWQQTYGDPTTGVEWLHAKQASDGGYILVGYFSQSPVPASAGSRDTLFIKIDSAGAEQWRSIAGGSAEDTFFGLVEAGDGGFVAVGNTFSSEIPNKDPVANDVYVVKVSSGGALVRQVAYGALGGTGSYEGASDLVTTADGGYLLTGVTFTVNGGEWFVMKLDANLDKVWETLRPQGGFPWVIEATPDGGVIVAGGDGDASIVKYDLDPNDLAGPLVVRAGWPKSYGGADDDFFQGIDVTVDGGYVATGWYSVRTDPNDPNSAFEHAWVLEIDSAGNALREGVFAKGEGFSVRALPDGAFIMAGFADAVPTGLGLADLYLVKGLRLVTSGTVEGTVYLDSDATCSLTTGDAGTSFRLVQIIDTGTNDAFLAMTDASGAYEATVPPGSYTATLAVNTVNQEPPACGVSGQSHAVSVVAGAASSGNDFFDTCTCQVGQSLSGQAADPAFDCLSAIPTTPCPGYPWKVCYHVTNLCGALHQSANGSDYVRACIDLPPDLQYAGGAPTITTSNCGGGGNWHVQSSSASQVCFALDAGDDLDNDCQADLCVPVDATPAFLGGTVNAQLSSNQCAGPETFPAPAPLGYGTTCACDPNAVHVVPSGCGAAGEITGQELTYTVSFQNEGAGPAHSVVVTDALDADLDPSTLRIVGSSHVITNLQVSATGALIVRFDGIELPPETADAPGSQGSVTFAVSPKDPFADGTTIDNSASIVFDTNAPVATNTVVSTLYHGDPVPVVHFTATANGSAYDFSYTGGTTGATFAWDFGPNATPRTSTDANPAGVHFDRPGSVPVHLAVAKVGCSADAVQSVDVGCESVWSTSGFRKLGPRKRRVGSTIRLRFKLSYKGVPVRSQAQLDGILDSDFGRTPTGDCWPRLRLFTADLQHEVGLDAGDFVSRQPNPDGCFRFIRSGDLTLKLRLNADDFAPGTVYAAQVQTFTCGLSPVSNRIETRLH